MPEYRVSKQDVGLSLEEFLLRKIPSAPIAYLRKLIKTGKVKSHSKQLDANHQVTLTEIIQLPESNRILSLLAEAEKFPEILYESREILIINKPSGLAVHRSKGHEKDNLTDRVIDWSASKFMTAPVHRLDLETSGPILFGKGKKSCSELGKLMMAGGMTKIYLALVRGKLTKQGRLSTEILAKGKLKTAVSDYRIIAANDTATLLEIELHTGRQHQIRRQLASIGHPLFGDPRYQGPCPNQLPRLFLHCCSLTFTDPFQHDKVSIGAPMPEDLKKYLHYIELEYQSN
jgi:23S rRNA pseudouridine955/2504/2580 synthase